MIRKSAVLLCLALSACASGPGKEAQTGLAIATREVQPKYPPALADAGMQGCVLVSFEIRSDGHAEHYKVLDSVPRGMFDQTTMATLSEWQFAQPARAGRYARLINYRLSSPTAIAPSRECLPVPSYEALNPEAGKS